MGYIARELEAAGVEAPLVTKVEALERATTLLIKEQIVHDHAARQIAKDLQQAIDPGGKLAERILAEIAEQAAKDIEAQLAAEDEALEAQYGTLPTDEGENK